MRLSFSKLVYTARSYVCGGRSLLSFTPGPPETLNTYSHPQPVILVLRGCYHVFVVPSASRNIQAKETRFGYRAKVLPTVKHRIQLD